MIYMQVCVCFHVCMYVCMYVFIYVCMYVHMYVCMDVCVTNSLSFLHKHTHIYTDICVFVCMYVCNVHSSIYVLVISNINIHKCLVRYRLLVCMPRSVYVLISHFSHHGRGGVIDIQVRKTDRQTDRYHYVQSSLSSWNFWPNKNFSPNHFREL